MIKLPPKLEDFSEIECSDMFEYYRKLDLLADAGFDTSTYIIIKNRDSEKCGIGIRDPQEYLMAKLTL